MTNNNISQNTALLVMDVQNAIVGSLNDENRLMDSLAGAIETARNHEIPVIYVTIGFRKGYPEISSNNKSFAGLINGSAGFDDPKATEIHASVSPQPDDVVVIKKRFSAFTGSDLEVILRSLEINHLLLTGISTSGVVLSTVREAADKDYRLTVLSDCCADRDDEVHRVLMEKVLPMQAEVVSSQELI
jgi:nicotinamidase-related amidase